MDWRQVITLFAVIATNLGTIIALYIQMDKKMDTYRSETNAKFDLWRSETEAIMRSIQEEMKDFHGRLCAIEERGKK